MSALRLVEVIRSAHRIHLDAMERPCVDCEVGEPHCCPLLRSTVALVEEEE